MFEQPRPKQSGLIRIMGSNKRKIITCVQCSRPNQRHAAHGLCNRCYKTQPDKIIVSRTQALLWYRTKGQMAEKVQRRRDYDKARRGTSDGKAYRNNLNRENYINNPDFQARAIRNAEIRRMKLANVPGSHTEQEWRDRKAQYHYSCCYCSCSPEILTKEHIFPVKLGECSSDDIDNILPACISCNSAHLSDQLVSGLLAQVLWA